MGDAFPLGCALFSRSGGTRDGHVRGDLPAHERPEWTGRKLYWDPRREEIVDRPVA